MVPAVTELCRHVVNKIDGFMRVEGSCGPTTARTKGTLAFRERIDRGELVPIHVEVLIVPNLGASEFSVGLLHEKGVKLNLMANPPVLRDGNSAFPASAGYPWMCVLRILLNGQDKSRDNISSHTTVDTDSWHRRMISCRPRAVKQLAEELTPGMNDIIDSSGAGKPSEVGYTPAKLRTDETVDHGTRSSLQIREYLVDQNVLAGTLILTQEKTTRTMPDTYGIEGTCPTDSPVERITVRIVEEPILSTGDTAENQVCRQKTLRCSGLRQDLSLILSGTR